MTETIGFFCVWVWVLGVIFTPLVSQGEYSLGEAIWWPLIVVKHAVKGLWRVLFTGWKQ
jgi:hypothetical protein